MCTSRRSGRLGISRKGTSRAVRPHPPGILAAPAKPQDLRARILTMPDTLPINSMPSVFSPLAKALLDGFSEGVVVFDAEGRLLYTNQPAREALAGLDP